MYYNNKSIPWTGLFFLLNAISIMIVGAQGFYTELLAFRKINQSKLKMDFLSIHLHHS